MILFSQRIYKAVNYKLIDFANGDVLFEYENLMVIDKVDE